MLTSMTAREPLFLADDLCEYSRNLLQSQSPSKDEEIEKDPSQQKSPSAAEKRKKASLKAQQKQLIKKYSKVKQMTIDYYCREDLTVTTLKEFFEIFISSLKKEQAFHAELMSEVYHQIGVSMKFDPTNTQATLTIFLGGIS